MKIFLLHCSYTALFLLIIISTSQAAQTYYYSDYAGWNSATTETLSFDFTAANVAQANERGGIPPTNNTFLSNDTLTFSSSVVPYSFDVTFKCEIAGRTIWYSNNHLGASSGTHHDWSITFDAGVKYVGLTNIWGGAFDHQDDIKVYDVNGNLLSSYNDIPDHPSGSPYFFGVVSDEPIGKIFFDNSGTGGGAVVGGIILGPPVPVPGTMIMLFSGLIGIAGIRRKN